MHPLPIESQQEAFRSSAGASPSAIDNTFASFPGRVPLRTRPAAPPSAQEQKPSISANEDPNSGVRVRIRPVGTIGNNDPTRTQEQPNFEVTSPRARQPLVTRPPRDPGSNNDRGVQTPEPDSDTRLGPTGVRVVRVRPTNRPFRTENFTPVEFIPQQEATPPPVISRVRGRPIGKIDF